MTRVAEMMWAHKGNFRVDSLGVKGISDKCQDHEDEDFCILGIQDVRWIERTVSPYRANVM